MSQLPALDALARPTQPSQSAGPGGIAMPKGRPTPPAADGTTPSEQKPAPTSDTQSFAAVLRQSDDSVSDAVEQPVLGIPKDEKSQTEGVQTTKNVADTHPDGAPDTAEADPEIAIVTAPERRDASRTNLLGPAIGTGLKVANIGEASQQRVQTGPNATERTALTQTPKGETSVTAITAQDEATLPPAVTRNRVLSNGTPLANPIPRAEQGTTPPDRQASPPVAAQPITQTGAHSVPQTLAQTQAALTAATQSPGADGALEGLKTSMRAETSTSARALSPPAMSAAPIALSGAPTPAQISAKPLQGQTIPLQTGPALPIDPELATNRAEPSDINAPTRTASTAAPPPLMAAAAPPQVTTAQAQPRRASEEVRNIGETDGLVTAGDAPRAERSEGLHTTLTRAEAKAAHTATNIGQQMAAAARQSAPGLVELRLYPEELGRLRMQFDASEQTLVVTISADRPETTDLMRRHIDQLAREMQTLGYRDVNFRFSGDGNQNGNAPGHQPGSQTGTTAAGVAENDTLIPGVDAPAPPKPTHLDAGLDLRI